MAYSDMLHLQLCGKCVICQHSIDVGEATALVLGDTVSSIYQGCTSAFLFPPWRPCPSKVTIHSDTGPHPGHLCRSVRCSMCAEGQETFAFHVACFNFLNKTQPKFTPSRIWHAGTWLRPLPKEYASLETLWSLRISSSLCKLMSEPENPLAIGNKGTEVYSLVKNLSQLPFEIQAIVSSYSSNSLLWRFAFVCAFAEDIVDLGKANTIVKSLPLHRWDRGTIFEQYSEISNTRGLVRFGLDGLGIRVCQVLENINTTHIPPCAWYVVEKASSLQGLKLESSGGFLRFPASLSVNRPFTWWDCPDPPNLEQCRFVGYNEHCNRLRCIDSSTIFGLTVFSVGGLTYGIHAHTKKSPSALETYRKIPSTRAQFLVWKFFPLSSNESISAVWVRHRLEEHNELAYSSLMLCTTHNRMFTFGYYIEPETGGFVTEPIGTGSPVKLLYNDPDPGKVISFFGATYDTEAEIDSVEAPIFSCPAIYSFMHLSHASLNNVSVMSMFLEEGTGNCLGLWLQYHDGRQECLGQCRAELDEIVTIASPSALHISTIDHGKTRHSVQIKASTAAKPAEVDDPSWTTFQMRGHITWWFNHNSTRLSIDPDGGQYELN